MGVRAVQQDRPIERPSTEKGDRASREGFPFMPRQLASLKLTRGKEPQTMTVHAIRER